MGHPAEDFWFEGPCVVGSLGKGERVNRSPSSGDVSDVADVPLPSELTELERIALRRQFEGPEPLRNPDQKVAVGRTGSDSN